MDLADRFFVVEAALTASEEGMSHVEFRLHLDEMFADGGQFQKALQGLFDKKKPAPEKLGKVIDSVIETGNKKPDPVVVAILKNINWEPILRDGNILIDRIVAALRRPRPPKT